jgi:hypothetical protein
MVDICDDTRSTISHEHAVITSSNYPKYAKTEQPCEKKIVAPEGYSIDLWIEDLDIKDKGLGRKCAFIYLL